MLSFFEGVLRFRRSLQIVLLSSVSVFMANDVMSSPHSHGGADTRLAQADSIAPDDQITPPVFQEWLNHAEQGNPVYQALVADAYLESLGVAQDYHKAAEWYQKAAQQGDSNGLFGVGHLHSIGKGLPLDDRKALDYFMQSAHQGNPNAHVKIGTFHRDGRVVARDLVKAYQWFHSACTHQSMDFKRSLIRQMSPQQFRQAKQLIDAASRGGLPGSCDSYPVE